MSRSFDVIEFADYLRRRWRLFAIACVTALILSAGISFLLPKRYTATAVLSIDPPAGNDARLATAVSPVYLESLKGYERFASSDSAFARAAERFHLAGAEPLETLKRRVLKVSKLRDTRILEISATLPNPKQAHELAVFLAEEAVALNQEENRVANGDLLAAGDRQLSEARRVLDRAAKELSASAGNGIIDSLRNRTDGDIELLNRFREQLSDLESDPIQANEGRAAAMIRGNIAQLKKEIDRNSATIGKSEAARDAAETTLRMAQTGYETLSSRLTELRANAAGSGERLRMIDPGIIPQRPSSPVIALNISVALLFTVLVTLVYLAVSFGYGLRSVDDWSMSFARRR